jgi:hypothetical protein
MQFSLPWIPLLQFVAYVRASGGFCVSWGSPTVPLSQILHNRCKSSIATPVFSALDPIQFISALDGSLF